ncbi:hypothetical protein L1887_40732 [Cichorium endivia]|nr:hypothetical protein L1887_40732 [Cichorium endivia]
METKTNFRFVLRLRQQQPAAVGDALGGEKTAPAARIVGNGPVVKADGADGDVQVRFPACINPNLLDFRFSELWTENLKGLISSEWSITLLICEQKLQGKGLIFET